MGLFWLVLFSCRMSFPTFNWKYCSDFKLRWLRNVIWSQFRCSKKDLGRATAKVAVLSGKSRINQFLFYVDQDCLKWGIMTLRAKGVRHGQWALYPGWPWKNGRSISWPLLDFPSCLLRRPTHLLIQVSLGCNGWHFSIFGKSIFKALLWGRKHFS